MAVPEGGKIILEEGVMIGPRVQFEYMNHVFVNENGEKSSRSGIIKVKKKRGLVQE